MRVASRGLFGDLYKCPLEFGGCYLTHTRKSKGKSRAGTALVWEQSWVHYEILSVHKWQGPQGVGLARGPLLRNGRWAGLRGLGWSTPSWKEWARGSIIEAKGVSCRGSLRNPRKSLTQSILTSSKPLFSFEIISNLQKRWENSINDLPLTFLNYLRIIVIIEVITGPDVSSLWICWHVFPAHRDVLLHKSSKLTSFWDLP